MRKLTAATLILLLALSFVALGAVPAGSTGVLDPDRAVDRELVSQRLDADGNVTRTSLLDSLSVYGNGAVRVTDRNEPRGLRNLSGFLTPASTSGIDLTWDVDVQGAKEILTVAPEISRTLPVAVTPRYFIGGKQVKAAEVRGYSGQITIEYELANLTARTQSFDVKDKTGKVTPTSLETFVPFVAQTSLELPADTWREITATDGTIVTDENKVQHVTFTSILAPLIGSTKQTARLTATVENLELGEVRIVFQPLLPAGVESTVATTAEGAGKLFDGVGQIDANLIKLQQGTLALVAGLTQLYEGILEAQAGLGSVGKSDTIVDGLNSVLAGLKELGDTQAGVPAIQVGVDELISGLSQVVAGLGSAASPTTVLGGLAAIDGGLDALGAPTGLPAAKGGVDSVRSGLTTAGTALTGLQAAVGGSVAEIQGAMATLGCPGSLNPACPLLDSALNSTHGLSTVTVPGLAALATGTTAANAGLGQVSSGLSGAIGAVGQLSAGVTAVTAGVNQIKAGLASGNADNPGILEGMQAVAAGLTEVVAGIGTVGAADTLTDGVDRLLSGSQDLASGVSDIAAGTSSARSGAEQIGSGQGALSTQGTRALQAGIGDNVRQASAALAVLGSMKERAANESFLYGPPEGADGSSTFVVRVSEITKQNMETIIRFAIGAVLLLALVAASVVATRRTMAAIRPV